MKQGGNAAWAALLTLAVHFLVACSPETDESASLTSEQGTCIPLQRLNAGVPNTSGDHTAEIRITYPDGSPAAELEYRLELPLSGTSVVVVAQGTLSPAGEARIERLAGGTPPVVHYLYVDDHMVDSLLIEEGRNPTRFEGMVPVKAGMPAPDMALKDLASGDRFRLSDLRGRVILLEFYTTQCAPCQPALAKRDALAAKHAAEWEGKVSILAAGLDAIWQPKSSTDAIIRHFRRKGWRTLRPVVPDQEFSWDPRRRFPFGVNGVPHAFLIRADGTVAWSGYPGDLEAEITALLKEREDARSVDNAEVQTRGAQQ